MDDMVRVDPRAGRRSDGRERYGALLPVDSDPGTALPEVVGGVKQLARSNAAYSIAAALEARGDLTIEVTDEGVRWTAWL